MKKRKVKRNTYIKTIILNHLNKNMKEYIILLGIFTIGIICGTFIINTSNESIQNEITEYIKNAITNLTVSDMTSDELFFTAIKQNLLYIITLWFFGITGIGIIAIYFLIAFKGYCISYSISAIIATLGIGKGLLFITSYLLIPNIILIPTIAILAIKGINLSKNILNNKSNKNIKTEIFKYIIFLIIIIIITVIISLIEVFISRFLLNLVIKYIL